MKSALPTRVALVVLATAIASLASDSLEKLKARADAASGKQQAKLCLEYVQGELDVANSLFSQGQVENGQAAIAEVVAYSEKGTNAAIGSRKYRKETEIELRRTANRLHDIADSLSFEDRDPAKAAVEKIQQLRSRLLASMFGPKAEP